MAILGWLDSQSHTSPHSGQWDEAVAGGPSVFSAQWDVGSIIAGKLSEPAFGPFPDGYVALYVGALELDTTAITPGFFGARLKDLPLDNVSDGAPSWALYVAAVDFGASLTTADWPSIATLTGLTPIVTVDGADLELHAANLDGDGLLTIELFPSMVNAGGITRLIFYVDRHVADDDADENARATFETFDETFLELDYPPGAPTVDSVTPVSGDTNGGLEVIIAGTDFVDVDTVHFGIPGDLYTAEAADFTVDSDTQITATTPPHAVGTYRTIVTTPEGSNE